MSTSLHQQNHRAGLEPATVGRRCSGDGSVAPLRRFAVELGPRYCDVICRRYQEYRDGC